MQNSMEKHLLKNNNIGFKKKRHEPEDEVIKIIKSAKSWCQIIEDGGIFRTTTQQ